MACSELLHLSVLKTCERGEREQWLYSLVTLHARSSLSSKYPRVNAWGAGEVSAHIAVVIWEDVGQRLF